ncbi:MAG: DUF3419 family protein [Myxococcota bacterium]
MAFRDLAFQRTFSKMFVYNVLYEDSEQDDRFLQLNQDSSVLSISGAGCGIAGMLAHHPRTIDAVDVNKHHLAITGLKVSASQNTRNHEELYDLFGRGSTDQPKRVVGNLAQYLPAWMETYWSAKWKRFRKSFYQTGLTAQMMRYIREQSELNIQWLRSMASQENMEARYRMVEDAFRPVFERPWVKWALESPLQLLALGVNFEQRDRMLDTEGLPTCSDFFMMYLKRLAETDLETNWFIWLGLTGQFNHENEKAVPPYLRQEHHARASESPTRVRFHNRNIFDHLEEAQPNTWSHYTLCDAPDWMNEATQKRLINQIRRTGRDGAIILTRSVETDSFIDRIDGGKNFRRLDEASDIASQLDRSKLYRRVDFHQLAH